MRFDNLAQPLSEADPAGPDLDEAMDNGYSNYVMAAEGRMPARFFTTIGEGKEAREQPFDNSVIDKDGERTEIAALLRRTRDARLVTLDAAFHALVGDIVGFSEAVQGLGAMVSTLWETFHPRPLDGEDYTLRRNAVEDLDNRVRIVIPLQYANITSGGRAASVTYRNYLVASGKAEARKGEVAVSIDVISTTLAGNNQKGEPIPELRERVATVFAGLKGCLASLDLIKQTFAAHVSNEYVPNWKELPETLEGMVALIGLYRPDLMPQAEVAAEGDADEATEGASGGEPRTPAGVVKSHEAAKSALGAIERYFLVNEPSSPALVLVHQARILIGRPLVEALDALMPATSKKASFRFDSGFEFDIDLPRMKSVTEDALKGAAQLEKDDVDDEPPPPPPVANDHAITAAAPPPSVNGGDAVVATEGASDGAPRADGALADGMAVPDGIQPAAEGAPVAVAPVEAPRPAPSAPPPPPAPIQLKFRVKSRAQASDLIASTESFFRMVEPSSPLPVLLSKARTFLSKDFASILSELMPRDAK